LIKRFPQHLLSRFTLFVAIACSLSLLLWPARRLRSENFIFYFPNQHKSLPVEMMDNAIYLPLIPLLNVAGQVTGLQEKRNSLKVWFGDHQLEFHENKTRIQVNKASVSLTHPVRRSEGQWMVPTGFIPAVLPQITGQPVLYQHGTTRAFIGNIHPVSYSVELQNQPSGVKLLIHFTGKVSIQTASTNGKWIIFLQGVPVAPLEQKIQFQNPYVSRLDFDDQDGRPKLIITPTSNALNFYPQISADGRVLTTALVKPPSPQQPALAQKAPATAAPPSPGATIATLPTKPSTPAPAAAAAPVQSLPVIVLDAGHGGQDSGARSQDGILEKNLVAQIVQKVEGALTATKTYRVILTRNGDADPSFEERTVTANTARPALFLTFHAGEMGARSPVIAVYTYRAPSPPPANDKPLPFIRWDLAQQPETSRSQQLAQDLEQQFAQISGANAPQPMEAPVRQLRSIAAPAVAIEVGTLSPEVKAGAIAQPAFQQQLAEAIVRAVEQFVPGGAKP
jgi:N-acetylmuramoyl-L-alanine amidase